MAEDFKPIPIYSKRRSVSYKVSIQLELSLANLIRHICCSSVVTLTRPAILFEYRFFYVLYVVSRISFSINFTVAASSLSVFSGYLFLHI